MSDAIKTKEWPVCCPHCHKQIGTSPDGKSLRAGKGAVLPGNTVSLHLNEGVIAEPEEGDELWVGCAPCWKAFTLKQGLQAAGH
jgi:hypothetical protein